MSVRKKVALELAILAILTTVFLLLFPRRNPLVDVALAGVALLALLLSSGYTRRVVWAAAPPPALEHRWRRCLKTTLSTTIPLVMTLLAIGMFLGYREGGWSSAIGRVFNWRILAAFGCYLPWALMQQTLCQFYLLGRLLALFPKDRPMPAVIVTGLSFSLVHLPDAWTSLATAGAGVVWTLIYFRYRLLLPLAFSHAALGSAFYYGLFGQDLAVEWRSLLP